MRALVKLRKTGNALAITIPRELANELNWKQGVNVFLETKDVSDSRFGALKVLYVEKA